MSMINNALSGSLAAQAMLNATSQNVANLQTAGYSRQGVLLAALAPGAGARSSGDGVEVSALLRFSDAYKSQQLWRAAASQGQYTQAQSYLTQLEQVMADDSSSLSAGIDKFFTALNAAAVDPTSSPLRQAVVSAADAMAQQFNSINSVIANQQLSLRQQSAAMVPQINTALANIALLNQKISSAGASGSNPAALLDARDQAVDGLAGLVALEVTAQPDGTLSVSLKSGQPLVIGALAGRLGIGGGTAAPALTLAFATSTFPLDGATLGGALGGLADFERGTLLPLQQSIADIANQLSARVNAQLAAGTTASGGAGAPLFAPGAAGALLAVSAGYQAADLAFSGDGTAGNSDNLQALIAIKSQSITLTSVGAVLVGDADTQLVGKLGIDSQQNQAMLRTADTVRDQALASWQATSGVNKDEEAVNLVEYQNLYQANMKVISVANALFDATLAMMD